MLRKGAEMHVHIAAFSDGTDIFKLTGERGSRIKNIDIFFIAEPFAFQQFSGGDCLLMNFSDPLSGRFWQQMYLD